MAPRNAIASAKVLAKPLAERRALWRRNGGGRALAESLGLPPEPEPALRSPGQAEAWVPQPDAATRPLPAKSAQRPKMRIGTLTFASVTEGQVYDLLLVHFPNVIAHGAVALSDDSHIEPDFILVHEVLPDGRFIGELADAKAVHRGKTAPHIEDDFRKKMDWLHHQTGLRLRIVTKQDALHVRPAALVEPKPIQTEPRT